MLNWAMWFLLVALLAGLFGLDRIAGVSAWLAIAFIVVFIGMVLANFVMDLVKRARQ